MGFYNYRFLNKCKEVIYVGKTKQALKTRIGNHLRAGHLPKECYKELHSIEFVEFETEADMDFMEIYFINRFQPRYNKKNLSSTQPKIMINIEQNWKVLKEDKFTNTVEVAEDESENIYDLFNYCGIKRLWDIYTKY